MTDPFWPAGAATGIGSLPGTDMPEAVGTVLGELPELPHLPELPARGLGADMIGRSAALLIDIAVEVVPSGYRVTSAPGRHHRRAVDLLSADLDALQQACEVARPDLIKVQAAGPWTLAAQVELRTGHRVVTDPGARRDFAASLTEGLAGHVAEVAQRTGAGVVVQLDEPQLPAVLAGSLPTASGYGTVRAVPPTEVEQTLRDMVDAFAEPVILHCCADAAPVELLHRTGAQALALDATRLAGAGTAELDVLAAIWDAGVPLLLGLVPTDPPDREAAEPELRALARPAFDLADRLGFTRARLGTLAVPTPTCGLAGASAEWAVRAMALCRDLGAAFLDPPESW